MMNNIRARTTGFWGTDEPTTTLQRDTTTQTVSVTTVMPAAEP